MSIQRPTLFGSMRRAPGVAFAACLLALTWSCESQQVGYEVAVPLIGPIDFNEMSCEISGDICSTDADCVDENGLLTGPCTMTLTPLEPIAFDVALSPSNPSYTFPVPDTSGWASLLASLEAGDSGRIVLSTQNFEVTGGPVTLSVRPFSRNGLILGRPTDYMPVTPTTPEGVCEVRLDESSSGDDYANGIFDCLVAWVQLNGAPLQFDIEVTARLTAATGSANPKSGFGLKQDPNFFVSGGDSWDTDEDCPGQTDTEVLDAVGEGSDFFDLLTCENLELVGMGDTSEPIEIYGIATIHDPCGDTASAKLGSSNDMYPLGEGQYQVEVFEDGDSVEVEGTDIVPVVFTPDAGTFLDFLFAAAAGECASGEEPPAGAPEMGFAEVDWRHCYNGTEDPEPFRTGSLTFQAQGFCPVADGNVGTGATGGSGE